MARAAQQVDADAPWCPWCHHLVNQRSGGQPCVECGKVPAQHRDWFEHWRPNTRWRLACSRAQQWLALSALLALVSATWTAVLGALLLVAPAVTPAPLVQQAQSAEWFFRPVIAASEVCSWAFLLLTVARAPSSTPRMGFLRATSVLTCACMVATAAVPVLRGVLSVIRLSAPDHTAWLDSVMDHVLKSAARPVLIVLFEQPILFAWVAAGAWMATQRQTVPGVRRITRAAAGTALVLSVLWMASWYMPNYLGTTAAPGVLQAWWSTWAVVGARTAALGAACLIMATQLRAEALRLRPASAIPAAPLSRPFRVHVLVAAPACMVLLGAGIWSLPISGPDPVALQGMFVPGIYWRWFATCALACAWTVPCVFVADRRLWKALLVGSLGAAASTLLSLTWNY